MWSWHSPLGVFLTPFPAVACFPAPDGLRLAVLGTCGGFLGTGRYGYFSAGVPGVFAFPVRCEDNIFLKE